MKKVLLFGLLGALGCLCGGVLGEAVLWLAAPALPDLAVAGVWTGLLALSLSLALVAGQNRYLRRPLLSPRQGLVLLFGSAVAGVLAGGAGQYIFQTLGSAAT